MRQGKLAARRRRHERDFADEPALRELADIYCDSPIVLYTGAGVSCGREGFGLPGWLGLLTTVIAHAGGQAVDLSADPWEAANQAVAACGGNKDFQDKLKEVISEPHNYRENYGQLSGGFLAGAGSLKAVAAFCGNLSAQVRDPKTDKHPRVHFRTSPNPRVRGILTANYDCFLESASSNLFRKGKLKPVTALGSMAGSMTRIPVFHVHGFVPHPNWKSDAERTSAVQGLVITTEDYERAWNQNDVFGTTMAPQVHYLRYFTTLFIGFSFTDGYVGRLLERVNADYLRHQGRSHFALMREDEIDRERMKRLGVRPIAYDNHDDIPNILGSLYVDALTDDCHPRSHVELPLVRPKTHAPIGEAVRFTPVGFWKLLTSCRNEGVGRGIFEQARAPAKEYLRQDAEDVES